MWELKDKYKSCCHNYSCDSFDTCIECWDEWAERNPPITNADRIRAMSDEELAVFLCDGVPFVVTLQQSDCLKWLKQPAEEVDDDTT